MNTDDGRKTAMDPEDRKVLENLPLRERRLALEVMAENPALTLERVLIDLRGGGM